MAKLGSPDTPVAVQPDPVQLALLTGEIAAASGPSGTLDRRIHDTLGFRSSMVGPCSADPGLVLAIVTRALPGWGYLISREPGMARVVAKLLRPPLDPDGGVTAPGSWSTHYAGAGPNDALAMIHAFLVAIEANALRG